MDKLYRPFTLNGHPVIFMDIPSAEMTKYAGKRDVGDEDFVHERHCQPV
jgi:hypothetical protein